MRASTSHTGPDWSNIFLVTIANAERLVRSVLCVIDSSQQTNETGSCVLFVKGIFACMDYSGLDCRRRHYSAEGLSDGVSEVLS